MSNTQLVSAIDYDTSRMSFSEPIQGSIPDSKPAISYSRINIYNVFLNQKFLFFPKFPNFFYTGYFYR